MSFFYKILFTLLAIALTIVLVTNGIFHFTAEKVVLSGVGEEALRIATLASEELSAQPDTIEVYEELRSGSRPRIRHKEAIDAPLIDIRTRFAEQGVENVYSIMLMDDVLMVSGDPTEGSPLPLKEEDVAHVAFKKALFESGKPKALEESYSDQWGVWMSAYGPITNAAGDVLALVGVDLPLGAFGVMDTIIKRNLIYSLLPALVVALLFSLIASRRINDPIQRLTTGLNQVTEGNLRDHIHFKRQDEFGQMAAAFNTMVDELAEKEKIQSTLHQAVSPEIATKILEDETSTEGEIVEGTVMFADIRGFTSLSDTISARDTISFVNEFLELAVPCILEEGGVVEKFVGDEIFAIFGVPNPLPQDSLQAVKAAVRMRDVIAERNRARSAENLPPIDVGIGINTGMMVAGVVGVSSRNNYTLLGSTVNEGARICSAAKPGEVIISQSTYLRVKDHFNVEAQEPLKAKGKTFAMEIFKVLTTKE